MGPFLPNKVEVGIFTGGLSKQPSKRTLNFGKEGGKKGKGVNSSLGALKDQIMDLKMELKWKPINLGPKEREPFQSVTITLRE